MKLIAIVFAAHQFFVLVAAHPLLIKGPDSPCTIDFSCSDPSYDLQDLKILLSPDPPARRKNLNITASGNLKKQISAGSKVKVQVKYNFIKLLNQEYDVCYLIEQMGKQCPIPAGSFSVSSTFAVPSSVISGKYYATFDATDQDGDNLACGKITCQI